MSMHPAVFLDLDNTVIQSIDGKPVDQVVLIKGAAPAIASLRGLGFKIVVVSNREDVASGERTLDDVETLRRVVAERLRETANTAAYDAFYFCPYHPKATVERFAKQHPHRKPKPGMLQAAAEDHQLDLAASWTIGDELADVQAGHAAGTRTILLRPDADRLEPVDPARLVGVVSEQPDRKRPAGPDFFAIDLIDAARLIAQQPRLDQVDHPQTESVRRWNPQKIAKLQVPRPASSPPSQASSRSAESESSPSGPQPIPAAATTSQPPRAFRPWGAEPAEPETSPPIRSRLHRNRRPPIQPAASDPPAVSKAESALAVEPAAAPVAPTTDDIPSPIREAIQRKATQANSGPRDTEQTSERDKLLRMMLQELRSQRGSSQEFSFLTIVAVALQLTAVVCLLGGLFMGSEGDGMFLRWMGVALVAQLMSIATLLFER